MPGDFIRLDSVCNGGPFCVMSIDGKTICICAEKKNSKILRSDVSGARDNGHGKGEHSKDKVLISEWVWIKCV